MDYYSDQPILSFLDSVLMLITTFACSVLLFVNLHRISVSKRKLFYYLLVGLLLCISSQLLSVKNNFITKSLYLLTMCLTLVLVDRKNLMSRISTAITCVGIVLCTEYVSTIISGTFAYLFKYMSLIILTTIIQCSIQILLCYFISRIKILKKAFVYMSTDSHFGVSLLIASYIFVFSLLLTQHDRIESKYAAIIAAVIPLIIVGLFIWIKSIVKTYSKQRLKDRADAYTQQEMVEKDEKIDRLEAEVATLAKQLHRDNHLLSSVDRSVQKLGESQSREQREQIIREIHTLYQERNDLMTEEQQANHNLPSTGIALIDSSLNEMYIKAAAHHILLDIIVKEQLHYIVNHVISQTDLQTLLCDHLKDAIIAIDTAKIDNGQILMTIEKNEGIFEISIHDNGVDFDSDTLSKLGKERVTTHSDKGGSGIGFMTTFETLAKAKGSLTITEHKNKAPFSKSITFIFNGLNRFIISSYRKEELKSAIARDDIIFV